MKDGARKAIPVRVQDFDPGKARFLVQNKEMDIETWRSRLYIRLPEDKREDLEAHKVEVMKRKAETLHYLRLHRLICGEMTKRYSYLLSPTRSWPKSTRGSPSISVATVQTR